ncbi:MAG: glycosyltransferase family 9 protein [Hydrogenothermaceae bacterium]|nr:glycosyltransferase family 9 protein [Hydrogenothermaceae bacterium]
MQPLYERGYTVDFLTFKPFDTLFVGDFRVNKVIGLDKKDVKSLMDLVRFAKSLDEYDYVIDLHKNFRSFIISSFTIGKVYRYNKNSIKRRLKILDENFNVVKSYLKVLNNLGIKEVDNYRPKIVLKSEEVEKVSPFLPDRFITLGTGARYRNKMYPFYNKVADIFLKKGYDIVLIGSKEDKEMDKNLYPTDVVDLRGKLSLRESIAVISKGLITVSNDSAVAHMSRATGVPVLMLYGATHPAFGFAPLEDEGSYIVKNIECQPCDIHGKGECKRKDLLCLTSIQPEEVVEKALKLIE